MTIQVQTRIKCPLTSDPDSAVEYRTVVFHRDGLISASGHGSRGGITHNITDEVRKLIVMVTMGYRFSPMQDTSAVAFAALLSGGLPRARAAGITQTSDIGAWLSPYVRWENNRLIKALLKAPAPAIARCVNDPVQLVELLNNQLTTDISKSRRDNRRERESATPTGGSHTRAVMISPGRTAVLVPLYGANRALGAGEK